MENPKYTLEYDNMTIIYEIEGDCDGAHVVIKSISGNNLDSIDSDTMRDIKFHAVSEYSDLQFKTYMKTGELI